MLTIAERTLSGLAQPQKVEEMDRELAKVIEDFDRAINVEALLLAKETRRLAEETRRLTEENRRLAKETSKHSFISVW